MVAVRCHNERHGWWHPNLGMWLINLTHEPTYRVKMRCIMGAPNAAASANLAAKEFLDAEADWLCIVDNDVVPPQNMLRILDDAPDCDAIGPVSHMHQHGRTLVQQGHGGFDQSFAHLNATTLGHFVVDQLGGGCWFVHRRAFTKMERPYFAELFDPETHMLLVSDDVYFQHKARELGCRLVCDTRFVVSHYHTVDLSDMTTAP